MDDAWIFIVPASEEVVAALLRESLVTPKQQRFVKEYLVDMNATQAAIRAGYSEKTANEQGCRLLTNVSIRTAVDAAQGRIATKLEITAETIVDDLMELSKGAAAVMQYSAAIRGRELVGKHVGMWPNRVEHTGKDGAPIQLETSETINIKDMPADKRELLRRALAKEGK